MAPCISTIGSGNNGELKSPTFEKDSVATLWSRYEHAKYGDSMKNTLIEDVIARYEDLLRIHQGCSDGSSDSKELDQANELVQALTSHVSHLQRIMNRDPHVLVLLDGDGMIFSNHLLELGSGGGKQAAVLLKDGVTKWAAANVVECPSDTKVVVRVYANLKGLAKACARVGHTSAPSLVEEFAKGFTSGNTLFDFVDVGTDNGAAYAKVAETFKTYVYNYHCRQVLLGCSHDNQYARLLNEYKDDESLHRVTLLEGAHFEEELAVLSFPKVKLPGLFRESKVDLGQDLFPDSRADSRVDLRSTSLNGASDIFTPRTRTPAFQSPGTSVSSPSAINRGSHVRSDSLVSSGVGCSENGTSTWSIVASKNKHQPLKDLHRASTPHPANEIPRNRHGQRVDIPMECDREEVSRLKKLKCCNQFYIGDGCCHYNAGRADKCPHHHDFKLTDEELKSLRNVARETPCKKGHDCDVPRCIYGHVCPFPQATQGSNRGIGCLVGPDCRFPRSMHDMDTVAVRMVRATGAF